MNCQIPIFSRLRIARHANRLRQHNLRTISSRPVEGILGLHRERPSFLGRKQLPKSLRKPLPKCYPSPPSARARCKDPLAAITATQLKLLDPNGARRRLFDKQNPEAAKVGDILLVRQKGGDIFAGTCMNIRRRGVDTAILLRNHLTRVGVEMWYKIFSPNVEGIEIVQKRVKRARRARLYYLRQVKHDVGSVERIVAQYIRQRQALRSGSETKGRDANAHKRYGRKK